MATNPRKNLQKYRRRVHRRDLELKVAEQTFAKALRLRLKQERQS